MSIQELPSSVEFKTEATQQSVMRGCLGLNGLRKLRSDIQSDVVTAELELAFGIDEGGWSFVKGQLKTELELVCQSCLEGLSHVINSQFQLAVVAEPTQMDTLPDNYEPLELQDGLIDMAQIIKEEILLNLPFAVKHEQAACANKFTESKPTRKAFANLQELLENNNGCTKKS